jgi:replicative DNA helicase
MLEEKTLDNNVLIDSIFSFTEDKLDEIKSSFSVNGDSMSTVLDSLLESIDLIHKGEFNTFLKTGCKELDKKIAISPDSIVLIGGAAKHGKTKLATYLVKQILEHNSNICCQWYTMEDSKEQLVMKFISPDCMIREDEIMGKSRFISTEEKDKVIVAMKNIKQYTIDIHDTPVDIKTIQHRFGVFTKKHKGQIPILVIDNALLLTDDGFDRDDTIMNTISRIRQKTKGLIIVIHHFNDGQQDKERLKTGYRPQLTDLKGREAYRRVPNQVILVNKPSKYKDLMSKYPMYHELLEYIYIVDVAANRGMKEIKEEGQGNEYENNLIYMFADLDYNLFVPLSELKTY